VRERSDALLGEYHRQFPLRAGMPREEVKSRLGRYVPNLTPKLFNEIVNRAMLDGWLAGAGGSLRLPTHEATFTPQQRQTVDYLLYTFRQEPYTTPSVAQCEAQVGGEVLSALVEQGQLVRLSDDVIFLAETYEEMRDRAVAYLQEHGSVTVAQIRDLFDTSRKYALAFLGYLDEKRVTRRVGDERVLRSAT
jgi:selenocysteine-specific elongation factor